MKLSLPVPASINPPTFYQENFFIFFIFSYFEHLPILYQGLSDAPFGENISIGNENWIQDIKFSRSLAFHTVFTNRIRYKHVFMYTFSFVCTSGADIIDCQHLSTLQHKTLPIPGIAVFIIQHCDYWLGQQWRTQENTVNLTVNITFLLLSIFLFFFVFVFFLSPHFISFCVSFLQA